MNYRFGKKVYNAEDGTRTLGFYKLDEDGKVVGTYVTFNLNNLEDLKINHGELTLARAVVDAIQAMTGFELTVEEIEYAVEDI